jgi:hypothetical protein
MNSHFGSEQAPSENDEPQDIQDQKEDPQEE